MKQYKLTNGINIYHLDSDKFKTFSVSIYLYRPLSKDEVTKNALLPQVLKSATYEYSTPRDIARELEKLYGANMGVGVRKKGEAQVLAFCFESVSDRYVEDNVTEKLTRFAYEVIYNPKIIDGAFSKDFVDVEKTNLKNNIEAMINDKREYATNRCNEVMCKDEAYGIYGMGSVSDIESISPQSLYEHYIDIIKNSKIDIFVSGQADISAIMKLFQNVMMVSNLPETKKGELPKEVKIIEEEMDVSQGKLVIGFRTDYPTMGLEYYNLMLFSSIYGGGAHSKLFNNVREKLSLAYYAYSRLVRAKGIVMVSTGIEFDKYDSAKEEIFKQLQEMKLGNISDEEIETAKASLVNAYTSLNDSTSELEDFYLGQILIGEINSVEDTISSIKKVKKEDIVKAANSLKTDTIYFLKGRCIQ